MAKLHALSEYIINTIGLQWALGLAVAVFLLCSLMFLGIVRRTIRLLKIRKNRNKFYISLINQVKSKVSDKS